MGRDPLIAGVRCFTIENSSSFGDDEIIEVRSWLSFIIAVLILLAVAQVAVAKSMNGALPQLLPARDP
jgi:hypothetical protein